MLDWSSSREEANVDNNESSNNIYKNQKNQFNFLRVLLQGFLVSSAISSTTNVNQIRVWIMDNAPTILVDFHANVREDIQDNDATLKLVPI